MNKPDLSSRADIDALMRAFYADVLHDPLIGHFFTEVAALDLEHHLPRIGDFWESVLFDTVSYRNDVMGMHLALHKLSPMKSEHFNRWRERFHWHVDQLFSGPVADRAKVRATSIATMMHIKVSQEG